MKMKITTNNEQETIDAGYNFAKDLELSDIVLLYGDLGAGKTEFCKGICRYFEVKGTVTSPTFTIINQYSGIKDDWDFTIYHIDLYRIKNQKEIEEIGLSEFLYDEYSIKLVEWPEKNKATYPENVFRVKFLFVPKDKNKRRIEIGKNQKVK
ncbi:MAG: tRNA (adenosine(37)-N6)-threonylcarbamoyltransferase complex ATPase subunit type 1 TsaE [bacterium]